MPLTIVVGLQWGDEGKGKIVDFLAKDADMVIRFNGGNNAGHTIINEHGRFVLHLIPAGIFNPKCVCIIERGVVVHPPSLVAEMETLAKQGIMPNNLKISPYAHLIMPWHIEEDKIRESGRGIKIGTTNKGVGPCYSDKAQRWEAIRVDDMANAQEFAEKIQYVYESKLRYLEILGIAKSFELNSVIKDYLRCREFMLPHIIGYGWDELNPIIKKALNNDQKILVESAQGALLDVDFGAYPYVTSSGVTSFDAARILRIPYSIMAQAKIVGIAKAYPTRVGAGPFPTSIKADELDKKLRELGKEYGATTGRPRKCGWMDLPLLRYAAQDLNCCTEIALTKMDILGQLPHIELFDANAFRPFEPWGDLKNCRSFDELPLSAQSYIMKIQNYIDIPIKLLSVGPERKEMIRV